MLGELRTKSHRDLTDALCANFSWIVCMNSQENPTSVSWVLGTDRPRDSELRTVVGKQVHGIAIAVPQYKRLLDNMA